MIKIIGINGSARKGKNTAKMIQTALYETKKLGCEAELLELSDYRILFCTGCNHCLREHRCSQHDQDDMHKLAEKLLEADGIIIGSPVYLDNVTGQMKVFMDRCRWLKMVKPLLYGKAGGALAHAALRNGGQELTNLAIVTFLMAHGLAVVGPIEEKGAMFPLGGVGSMFESQKDGKVTWKRSVEADEIGIETSKALGGNVARLAIKLSEK